MWSSGISGPTVWTLLRPNDLGSIERTCQKSVLGCNSLTERRSWDALSDWFLCEILGKGCANNFMSSSSPGFRGQIPALLSPTGRTPPFLSFPLRAACFTAAGCQSTASLTTGTNGTGPPSPPPPRALGPPPSFHAKRAPRQLAFSFNVPARPKNIWLFLTYWPAKFVMCELELRFSQDDP